MAEKVSIVLIGAGAMGGALLRGWLDGDVIDAERSSVFDPAVSDEITTLCSRYGLVLNDLKAASKPQLALLAIKPQMAIQVLPAYASFIEGAVVVSIMAGQTVLSIAKTLNRPGRIIRAMPNLPVAIGAGMTGMFAGDGVSDKDRTCAEILMQASGDAIWVEREEQIDFVTAISGSGPAYFYLMVEALASAGVDLGLEWETAKRLARSTAIGAGAQLANDMRSVEDIRKAVTSPKGTTQAALEVLDGDDEALRSLMKKAAQAAALRARELSD